jgi:hypothetical protein
VLLVPVLLSVADTADLASAVIINDIRILTCNTVSDTMLISFVYYLINCESWFLQISVFNGFNGRVGFK